MLKVLGELVKPSSKKGNCKKNLAVIVEKSSVFKDLRYIALSSKSIERQKFDIL